MFVEELRRAIEVAPRVRLVELSSAVWKGHAAGAIGDDDAQGLAELIQAKKSVVTLQHDKSATRQRRNVGSRPRSSDSMERRRRWCGSGWLPPQVAARFTLAEVAVLAVVAAEVARHGRCVLALDHVAALAGVSRSTVRNAMSEARKLNLITIQLRPARAWRSDTNVVLVVDSAWRSWISMRRSAPGGGPKGEGAIPHAPRGTKIFSEGKRGKAQSPNPVRSTPGPLGSSYSGFRGWQVS